MLGKNKGVLNVFFVVGLIFLGGLQSVWATEGNHVEDLTHVDATDGTIWAAIRKYVDVTDDDYDSSYENDTLKVILKSGGIYGNKDGGDPKAFTIGRLAQIEFVVQEGASNRAIIKCWGAERAFNLVDYGGVSGQSCTLEGLEIWGTYTEENSYQKVSDGDGGIVRCNVDLTIEDCILTCGYVTHDGGGGAIHCNGANLTIRRSEIGSELYKNFSMYGGTAIVSACNEVCIENSTIENNVYVSPDVNPSGTGVIKHTGGKITVTGCEIKNNSCRIGAALECEHDPNPAEEDENTVYPDIAIEDTWFEGNQQIETSSPISNNGRTTLTGVALIVYKFQGSVVDCTFTGHGNSTYGGNNSVISVEGRGDGVILNRCEVILNELRPIDITNCVIMNTLIADNDSCDKDDEVTAGGKGPGLGIVEASLSDSIEMINCTVVSNEAGEPSCRLFLQPDNRVNNELAIKNSIVWNNKEHYIEENYTPKGFFSEVLTISNSVCNVTNHELDTGDRPGYCPMFKDVGSDRSLTQWSGNCVNHGIGSSGDYDLDGNYRIVNRDGVIDIGAYEYQEVPSIILGSFKTLDFDGDGSDFMPCPSGKYLGLPRGYAIKNSDQTTHDAEIQIQFTAQAMLQQATPDGRFRHFFYPYYSTGKIGDPETMDDRELSGSSSKIVNAGSFDTSDNFDSSGDSAPFAGIYEVVLYSSGEENEDGAILAKTPFCVVAGDDLTVAGSYPVTGTDRWSGPSLSETGQIILSPKDGAKCVFQCLEEPIYNSDGVGVTWDQSAGMMNYKLTYSSFDHTIEPGDLEPGLYTFRAKEEGKFWSVERQISVGRVTRIDSEENVYTYSNLEKAIDAASESGDTIILMPGDYYETVDFGGKNITLRGQADVPKDDYFDSDGDVLRTRIIQREDSEDPIITMQCGTLQSVTVTGREEGATGAILCESGGAILIDNCYITGNGATLGAGVTCATNSNVTIKHSLFSYNQADYGAAVYCQEDSSLSMEYNTFEQQTASNGSAIYADGIIGFALTSCRFLRNVATNSGTVWIRGVDATTDVSVVDCHFGNNEATSGNGGAIYATTCKLTIKGETSFTLNKALAGSGGALALAGSDTSTSIVDAEFIDNHAYLAGGGVYLTGGTAANCEFYRCKFLENTTTAPSGGEFFPGYGGAVAIENSLTSASIKRSVFVGNEANWAGGILYRHNDDKTLTVENVTFINNRANEYEASAIGVASSSGQANVNNSIFWGNTGVSDYGQVVMNYESGGTLGLDNIASDVAMSATYYDVSALDGNKINDPFISSLDPVDWHLTSDSACNDLLEDEDLSSEAKIDIDLEEGSFDPENSDMPWDLGADEFRYTVRIQTDKTMYLLDETDTILVYFWGAKNADAITSNPDTVAVFQAGTGYNTMMGDAVGIYSQSQDSRLTILGYEETPEGATCYGTVAFDISIASSDDGIINWSFGDYIVKLIDHAGVDRVTDNFSIYPYSVLNTEWSYDPYVSTSSATPLISMKVKASVGTVDVNNIDLEIQFSTSNGSTSYTDWKVSESNGTYVYDDNDVVAGTAYSYRTRARYADNSDFISSWSTSKTVLTPPELEVLQAVGTSPNGRVLMRMIPPEGVYDPTTDTDSGITYDFTPSDDANEVVGTPYWIDEDASTGTTYTLRWNMPGVDDPSGYSNDANASDVIWDANDTLAPFPSPMRWAADPTVSSNLSTIALTAVTAIDINETVEYLFTCTRDANYTSDWQSNPTYEANSLPINTAFTFTVQARDGAGNVGEVSDPVTVWTDNTPYAVSGSDLALTVFYSIIVAQADVEEDGGSPPLAVEYARMDSLGASDDTNIIKRSGERTPGSSWSDYTFKKVATTFYYSYRVLEGSGWSDWSPAISATTVVDDRYPSPDPMAWDANTPIHYEGKTCVIIAAQEAVLPSTLGAPIEYRFNCSDANFTSDWQDSPVGEIRGLQPSTNYYFTVQARRGDYGYEDYVTGLSPSLLVSTQSGAWTQGSIVRDVELDIWYEDLGIAMFEAASGHHLELQPGTHSLTEPLTFAYNSGLTLCSTDPEDPYVVAATILDASQCAPIVVFQGETWEDPVTSRLEGLTITGADDPNVDGAIQVQGYSSAALSNCVLSYNTTGNGGAIYTYTGSELLLSDCLLHDNTADLADGFKGFGGAIYGSTVTLSDCELYENQADRGGGAIYVTDLTMTRSSVHDNETVGSGGAILSNRPNLTGCQIYNNISGAQGGGLNSYTSASIPAVLTNCLFKNNEAVNGGGLRCSGNPGAAVIRGCVFVDNTSTEDGGGISMNGALTLSNCTVVDNTAISTGAGGGIYQGNGDFDLINCLFAGNTPTPYPSGNIYSPDLYSCLIQGATLNGSYAYLNGDPIGQLEGGVLLSSDPLLVDDYHLDPNSPCVDAGLNSVTKPITDIDGELRTVNGTVDIGADEYFEADEIPPSPVAWDIAPVAVDCNTVTMTAVIASDASGPVVYRFDCNDANFSSGWQIDPNYTVDGLTPEATYSFSLQARDAAGNLSSATSDSYVTLPSETASFVATNLTGGGSYETIEAALDDASNGDVIQIQTGTYDVALDLDGLDITLCGTDPNDPNVVAATILTNSSDGPVLTFPTGSNCQIKGLTITDCNNLTSSGGGVYATNSDLIFQQCRIVNCHTTGNGGGLYGYDCDVTLVNCEFLGNSASGYGGGVYTDIDDLVKVVNCVFYQNSAATGGGIYLPITTSESTCTHSTFVDNTASVDAGGLFGFDSVDNSIFWGNRSSSVGDYHIDGSPAPNMTAGLIEGGIETDTQIKASDNSTIAYKNGGQFVFEDPCFVNGYYLPDDSSAIDNAHDSDALLDVDIAGQPRIVGVPDLGAYEVQNRQAFGLLASTLGYDGEVRTGGDADWSPTIFDWPTSGEIEDSQFTWMSAFIDGAGTASFNWRSYSEASSDYLQCYADGVLLDELSGVSGTQSVTHQFNLSGPHVMRWVYIKDTSGYGSYDCGYVYNMSFTPSTPTGDPTGVITATVNSDEDDVEEDDDGVMELTDSDLDLKYLYHQILVGLRFSGVGVPQGATILDAYLTVQADESDSSTCSLEVWAQASDDAEPFTSTAYDLSSRSVTTASVTWSPETYVFPNYYNSPDLSSIIQEVVDRPDWLMGNGMVLKIQVSEGERVFENYPVLHIQYQVP